MDPTRDGWRFAACALIALSVAGCDPEAAAEEAAPPPPVHVDPVVRETRVRHASGTSELSPRRRATLSAEAPGRVLALDVERGQRVEQGQVLMRLDVGRTTVAAQAAAASITQAEAAFAQAERERALAAQLAASGSASRRSFEQAEDAESLARAALEQARAQARLTRRGLTEAVLRAPFGGVVVERRVEIGEYLAPGTPVAVIMDASVLRADVLLDPRDALDVEPGARVVARVFARPGEEFEGEVVRVGEAIDRATRRLPIEVEVDDPAGRLRPGLVARFQVQTGAPREVLTVDADAAFERFAVTQIYVVDDGLATRRVVSLGALEGGRAEVLDGLEAGERVVVEGQDRVLDGERVNVVERPPSLERAHARQ